ncbi:MAG: YchF/TatD family DNA exonuclease [Arsenophonus sp.]|nr:MAG: YchF/TatD family DNA exonuclease [Arsenophonus sp.]
MKNFFIDSHCHLNDLNHYRKYQNIQHIINKAQKKKVKYILSISTSLKEHVKIYKKINQNKNIFMSCGIHPQNVNQIDLFNQFEFLASKKKVIALGETGLDYYIKNNNKILQQKIFSKHIFIGKKLKKPIIIHMRKSEKDVLNILKNEKIQECGGIIHCFNSNKNVAKKMLDLGLYISFSGILTFKNAENIRQTAKTIPMDRILIETDSPYLTPVPHRGKENEPSYIIHTAKILANIKKINIDNLAKETTKNFCTLFKLKLN